MSSETKAGIWSVALAAMLSVVACGGSASEPKMADAASTLVSPDVAIDEPAPPEGAKLAGERSAAPAGEAAPQFSDEQRVLLCGPQQSVTGGVTLEAAEKAVLDQDKTVEQHFQTLLKALPKKCGSAADALYEQFESEMSVSRTWCDHKLARGIGVKGDELAAQTELLATGIRQRNDEMKQKSEVCVEKRVEQIAEIVRWRGERDILCGQTPKEQRVIECGIRSSSATWQEIASNLCRKDADALARTEAQKNVARCLGPAERSPGADKRSLERDAGGAGSGASLETRLLTGTAEFFEARAKEEAKLFAYEVVKNHLCDCESEVKPYLVNTCALFESDETLAATPGAIREAVRADLDGLPAVLVGKLRQKNQVLACGAALAWTFGSEAIEGADVLELLANAGLIVNAPLVKDPQDAPACTVATRELIVEIAAELKKQLQDRPRLERAVKEGNFARALSGDSRTRDVYAKAPEYAEVLEKVLARVRQLDQAHQAWRKDPSRENRAAVVRAGLRTIEPIVAFAVSKQQGSGDEGRAAEAATLAIKLTGQLVNREYAASVVTAAQLGTTAKIVNGTTRNLLGLAAGLAQAESSDEVRATLEDAALPLGSWRRKNEKRVGLTLTGLVGVQAGYEIVLEKTPADGTVEPGSAFAPTLLIGPDVHYGTGKGIRIGAQLSILDLGALLSFRLSDPEVDPPSGMATETAEQTPDIKVEQVFSPGLYPYLGIGPFTIGPAFSFVPSLRRAGTAASQDSLNVIRVGGFAAVDVSVLPLY
ncbi:MAG TPA: hypothetical protein VJN18_22905 [Polyangiaceae bacterium]|nr:hypothetical protein [Polyangiaceae bacterium]